MSAPVQLCPLVYVSDVDAAIDFYRAFGFTLRRRTRPGNWAELEAGEATLALHGTDPLPAAMGTLRVELVLEARAPLEEVVAAVTDAGYGDRVEPIVDEAFGRSVGVRDPDGMRVQINEFDPDLYT
jgi:catechol 2,3-dioxygenase-like lactoylglutathione lyase family enzyme